MNTAEDYALALKSWEERQGAGQTAISSSSLSGSSSVSSVTCTVELFGVARLLAKTKEVALYRCRRERSARVDCQSLSGGAVQGAGVFVSIENRAASRQRPASSRPWRWLMVAGHDRSP